MKKIYYTDDEAKGLLDCEVLYSYTEWRNNHKFLKRGQNQVTVLAPYRENQWLAIKRNPNDVRINGKQLEYIGKYSFTNPKQPFTTQ